MQNQKMPLCLVTKTILAVWILEFVAPALSFAQQNPNVNPTRPGGAPTNSGAPTNTRTGTLTNTGTGTSASTTSGSSTTNPPTQTPADIAYDQGKKDGDGPGFKEGAERGSFDGTTTGTKDGINVGYKYCRKDILDKGCWNSYHAVNPPELKLGYPNGHYDGRLAGQYEGERSGKKNGENDGAYEGDIRADQQGKIDGDTEGKPLGIKKANESDAEKVGKEDGEELGKKQAYAEAVKTDFPRGKKAVYNEKYSEPIKTSEQFKQKNIVKRPKSSGSAHTSQSVSSLLNSPQTLPGQVHGTNTQIVIKVPEYVVVVPKTEPNYKFRKLLKSYGTDAENLKYKEGYNKSYRESYLSEYANTYRTTAIRSFNSNLDNGCDLARREDHSKYFLQCAINGYQDGHEIGYSETYETARFTAYNIYRKSKSDSTYKEKYPEYKKKYSKLAEDQAYDERYKKIYDDAHENARAASYDDNYYGDSKVIGYQEQEFQRGRAAETADFNARPVRLIGVKVSESYVNDMLEPLEKLYLNIDLRNFSELTLNAQDIVLKVTSNDNATAVVSVATETSKTNIKPKSVMTLIDSLEFQLTEASVQKNAQITVEVFYKGQSVGVQDVLLYAKYPIVFTMDENPFLKEGFETPIKVTVKNTTNETYAPGLRFSLTSDPNRLEITKGQVILGELKAGATQELEFVGISRKSGGIEDFTFNFDATYIPEDRPVGVLNTVRLIPVINDYRLELNSDSSVLRTQGVKAIEYQLTNISTRQNFESLQVQVEFKDSAESSMSMIGPNPQLIRPLRSGKSTRFTIPVAVANPNNGGTLLITVYENGNKVAIHKVRF